MIHLYFYFRLNFTIYILYLHTVRYTRIILHSLLKGICDTPLLLFSLKFHDLHPFLIYTPTPGVYAHPIKKSVIPTQVRSKNLPDLVGIVSVSVSLLHVIVLPLRLMGLLIVTVALTKEPLL